MLKSGLKFLMTTIIFLIFTSSTNIAQDYFQGEVTFEAVDEGQMQKMSYLVKGNKFRIQGNESEDVRKGAMIYDAERKIITILMSEQKMYMEMPMNASEEFKKEKSNGPEYFTNTGNTKDVMGYSCDEFIFKDENREGVAWMTQELGPFLFMGDPEEGGDSQFQWQKEIMEAGYFPLLIKKENSSGELRTIFKVLELNARNLSDELFSVPSDFNKFEMPNMMDLNRNR
jgi:hypothetical protein